jgi:hypothetical protein
MMKLTGLGLLCTLCVLGAAAVAGASGAEAAARPQPGDYCPFPEEGQKPACLAPAQQRYSEFFEAVDAGQVSQLDQQRVADDLATGGDDSEDPFLALSSLTYAYYSFAERASSSLEPDPLLVTRLEQWNRLLSSAYEADNPRPRFREALLRAVDDLYARAPAVPASCQGDNAGSADCSTGGLLVQAMQQLDDPADEHGVRGALSRLLRRMFGWGDR